MFTELSITSNFSFLKGASHPEEYIRRAATLRMEAIAIADENSVAGIVRAFAAAREMARLRDLREKEDQIGPPCPPGCTVPCRSAAVSNRWTTTSA